MKRWVLRVFAGLLAAATVALAVEWRRSYLTTGEFSAGWHRDSAFDAHGTSTAVWVLSRFGRIDVGVVRVPSAFARTFLEGYLPAGEDGFFSLAERHLEPSSAADAAMFKFERSRAGRSAMIDVSHLRFPHWLAVLVTAAATAVLLAPTWRRFQRRRRGLCLRCGYDLRSSTDRCPECGEPLRRTISREAVGAG